VADNHKRLADGVDNRPDVLSETVKIEGPVGSTTVTGTCEINTTVVMPRVFSPPTTSSHTD
jgi:hypothetical protein